MSLLPEEEIEWDAVAESQLRSIEAAYYQNQTLKIDPNPRPPKSRRLPDWGRPSADEDRRDSHSNDPIKPSSCPQNDTFRPLFRPCRSVNSKVRFPSITFGGRISYSRTASEVKQAASEIMDKVIAKKQTSDHVSMGFDIEWKPVFRKGEPQSKAAVMQICMDFSHCYVLHIIHSGIPPLLRSLLEDSFSIKVGICIDNDARKIFKDYNVLVKPLEDLSTFANIKFGGTPKNWSLASLTEAITCKQLEKPNKIRLGNWETDVLSKEQLCYAATDAFVSWHLYEILANFPDAKVEKPTVEDKDHAPS